MCVIIAMENKIPDKEVFKNCEETNSHGGGISWVENGSVRWKKGIKYEEIYDIAVVVGPPCIAHFRISTVGGTPDSLTHPFVVNKIADTRLEGNAKAVLFHNGVWKDWRSACRNMVLNKNVKFPDGDWSDSRAMAWLSAYSNTSWLGLIDQKVLVQTAFKREYYGDWNELDGVYYSNLHWKPRETLAFNRDNENMWWNGYTKDKKGYKNPWNYDYNSVQNDIDFLETLTPEDKKLYIGGK